MLGLTEMVNCNRVILGLESCLGLVLGLTEVAHCNRVILESGLGLGLGLTEVAHCNYSRTHHTRAHL